MATSKTESKVLRNITLRTLVVGIAAGFAVHSAFAQPRQKPPSSLHKPSALIRVVHMHERVAGCQRTHDGKACKEQRVASTATTEVAFQPVSNQLISAPQTTRHAITLKLTGASGSAKAELRLEPGNWLLLWEDQRAVIRVDEQRDFSIALSSISGTCISEKESCKKMDGPVRRTLRVPAEFLAGQ